MSAHNDHVVIVQLAEISSAISANLLRAIEGMPPDQYSPESMIEAMRSAISQNQQLASFYADKFEQEGNDEWAGICRTWASDWASQANFLNPESVDPDEIVKDFLSGAINSLDAQATYIAFGATAETIIRRLDNIATADDVIEAYLNDDSSALIAAFAAGAMASMVSGIVAAGGVTLGLAGWPLVAAVTVIGAITNTFAEDAFDSSLEHLFEFAREDQDIAEWNSAIIQQLVGSYGSAVLPRLGDYVAFANHTGDYLQGLSNTSNSLIGGIGADIIHGGDFSDRISGGGQDDLLSGGAGDDLINGNAGDDNLIGGTGSDRMNGGDGFDTYQFSVVDFTADTEDVVFDSDGYGAITVDHLNISGTGIGFNNIRHASLGSWETSDGSFRLTVVGASGDASLIIMHRGTGGRIVVRNWSNGDLGITLPDLGAPGTPGNPISQTNGDDLVGRDGDEDSGTQVSGDDFLLGLGGNDGIDGGYGDDRIDGGAGDDLIFGGAGDDDITGGAGNDIIIDRSQVMNWRQVVEPDNDQTAAWNMIINRTNVGVFGNGWWTEVGAGETATGNAPDWIFSLSVGALGWYGQNVFVHLNPDAHPSGNDIIDAGEGSDTVYSGAGHDVIDGGTGNDLLVGAEDNDSIDGGDGDDLIFGDVLDISGSLSIAANPSSASAVVDGNDILVGGAGNDRIYGQGGSDVIDGGAGDDLLLGDLADWGLQYGIVTAGQAGNDYIDGGDGNDNILGNAGDDTLLGGAGDDEIEGDDAVTEANQHGHDVIEAGAGADTVWGGGGNDTIRGGDGDDTLSGDYSVSQLALEHHGNDTIYGEAGNDTIIGDGGSDYLDGGADDDILDGKDGNDRLVGGSGQDQLIGGLGDDSLDGGEGRDQLWGGEGNDTVSGGEGDDQLWGDRGDQYGSYVGHDTLMGGDGNDKLNGEGGDDTLFGDAGNDILIGGAGSDRLHGGAGNDTLSGHGNQVLNDSGVSSDILYGDAGNDTLNGGNGNDILDGGTGNDILRGSSGSDQLFGGDGNDTLIAHHIYYDGSSSDYLEGGRGNDRIESGPGANTIVYSRGDGFDTVVAEDPPYNKPDILRLEGGLTPQDVSIFRMGRTLVFVIDNSGHQIHFEHAFYNNPQVGYNDALVGLDRIEFENGAVWLQADILSRIAPASANVLVDTAGDDVLQYDHVGDTIQLSPGGGIDTVESSISYSAPNNIENVTLTGLLHINATGNAGNNALVGNVGNNVLTGRGGFDVGAGGLGDDTYINVESISESVAEGYDIAVYQWEHPAGNPASSISLNENVEELRAQTVNCDYDTGTYVGNSINNRIYIVGGQNAVIDGGGGADEMIFVKEQPKFTNQRLVEFIVDNVGDTIQVINSGNHDLEVRVTTSLVNYSMPYVAEALRTTSLENVSVIGNDGNNAINIESSGIGSTASGGLGNDTYTINWNQVVVEGADAGVDMVQIRAPSHAESQANGGNIQYVLGENVENGSILFRYGENGWFPTITLIGNDMDNHLKGDSGANILVGGAGADILEGGGGADIYHIDSLDDVIIGGGTVYSPLNYVLANNVDGLVLIGSATHGTGNSKANTIVGNELDNVIDTGSVQSGTDTANGGLGADTYIYNLGDRNEYIYEDVNISGQDDVLSMGEGVTLSDLSFSVEDTSWGERRVRISFSDPYVSTITIRLDDDDRSFVEVIKFDDGLTYRIDDLIDEIVSNNMAGSGFARRQFGSLEGWGSIDSETQRFLEAMAYGLDQGSSSAGPYFSIADHRSWRSVELALAATP